MNRNKTSKYLEIISNVTFIERHIRFTTVPLNTLADRGWKWYPLFPFQNWLILIVVSFQKWHTLFKVEIIRYLHIIDQIKFLKYSCEFIMLHLIITRGVTFMTKVWMVLLWRENWFSVKSIIIFISHLYWFVYLCSSL